MANSFTLEPERYELNQGPAYRFALDRRDFFKVFGAGLAVFALVQPSEAQESGRGGRGRRPSLPQETGAWLHVGEDGNITAYTGKAEMGQKTRTALTQAISEELRVPIASVKLVMADTDIVPFDMGTFGSRSMPDMLPIMRKVGATAREALLARAAELQQVPREKLAASGGFINGGAKPIAYKDLVKGQKLLEAVPMGAAGLTAPDQWIVMGKPVPDVNGRNLVTGRHQYTADQKLPGMLHARVIRPALFGAKLVSTEGSKAEQIPGVVVVRDGDFLGVAAPDRASAFKAAEAVEAKWSEGTPVSEADLLASLRKAAPAKHTSTSGSFDDGLAAADHKTEANYSVAYIAHAPLEPRAAVAQWTDGKLTVWTGSQRPFGVREELMQAFGLPENKVRVIVPDTGSGYGGKHTGEAAIEAARIAKSAGKPVKLIWTREEEFTWAYFRPAGAIDVQAGLSKDGKLTAWSFHNYNSGSSGLETPYSVANQSVHFYAAEWPLRQGSYRGLAATANHFAREVHMDELAQLVHTDPLEFRLRNLQNERLRAVIERAAAAFGWGKLKTGAGIGVGMGAGLEKGGFVASFAEVVAERDLKQARVKRVVTAFECGAIVNPDTLRNQVEGGVIMGLGGALHEAIHYENGRILNARFAKYRVPRFLDMPVIETVLVDRKDLPSAGAGETPIVAVAPAIANAIYSATNVRLRSLPLLPNA